jgi:DNA sulfur modification protein DndC
MLDILKDICGKDELHYELIRNMLDLERRYSTKASRRGLFEDLESEIKKCFYDNAEDALNRACKKSKAQNIPIEAIRDRAGKPFSSLDKIESDMLR